MNGLPSEFWWLWTSTLLNRLGTFVYPFLAIFLTSKLGYSAAHAGLVLGVYGIGASAGALIGGELSDRVGRRITMGGGQLLAAISTVALGFADGSASIALLALAVGATSSVSRPAVAAMIADIIPPADRARAFSVNYWAINIGFGFSAAAAGFLARGGYLWLFLIDAGTTLLCAALMWFKLPESRPPRTERSSTPESTRMTLRQVLRHTRFLVLCLLGLILWMLFFQGTSTLPIVMTDRGISTTGYGLVIALNGIVIVALQIPLSARLQRREQGLVLVTGALLTGIGFGLTSLAQASVLGYALGVVIWTLGEMVYAPAASATIADLAPVQARGRYQGVYGFSTSIASVLAPVLGGLVLDHRGASALWVTCAGFGAAAAAGFWLLFATGRVGGFSPRTSGPHRPGSGPSRNSYRWRRRRSRYS